MRKARPERVEWQFVPRRVHARVLQSTSPSLKRRGRRECRGMTSPMARLQQEKQAAVTTGSAGSTGIPCAMVLTVSFALSPGTGLSCPRHLRDAKHHRKLSLSVGRPGPHDFAVRISHVRPTCHPRPPHPRPTCRDDRPKRPSSSRRDAREHRRDLPDAASANTCGRSARRAICAWGACGGWPSGKTNVRQFGCEETGSKRSSTIPEDCDALEYSARLSSRGSFSTRPD